MANGRIKGKQIEDKTLDLGKLSGLGEVSFATSSNITSKGTFELNEATFRLTDTNIDTNDNFNFNIGTNSSFNVGDNFTISGTDIGIEVSRDILIDADRYITIDSGSDMLIDSGGGLSLTSSTDMSITSGGFLDIASDAPMTFTAAEINIEAVNLNEDVGGNKVETIGNNKRENIGGNKYEFIDDDKHENIGGDKYEDIANDKHEDVVGDKYEDIGNDKYEDVVGDKYETINGIGYINYGYYYLQTDNILGITGGSYSMIELGENSTMDMASGSSINMVDSNIAVTGNGKITIAGTAVDPDDVVTKKDLASVGGKLSISDYNNPGVTFSNVENIVFRGQTVVVPGGTSTGVLPVSGGPNTVVVWIPAPSYVDNFNEGDAVITPETTTLRNVANPNGGAYDIGDWTPGTSYDVLNEPSGDKVTYVSTDFSVFNNTSTTLELNLYGANGTIIKTLSTAVLNGTQTVTNGGLSINVSSFSPDEDRYKATATFEINLATALPGGGRFSVEIKHNNYTEGTFTFSQNDIFYDVNVASRIGSITIEEKTPSLVWRSGIAYYAAGSSFTFSMLDIDNINNASYPMGTTDWGNSSTSKQLRLTPENFNIGVKYGYTTDMTGWTSSHNINNLEWVYVDTVNSIKTYIPDLNDSNNLNSTVTRAVGKTFDWTESGDTNSAVFKALIDTHTHTSNDTSDEIGDEDRRLSMSNLTYNSSSWVSNATLESDALQVAFDKLIYPRENYSSYKPEINITNARDYTNSATSSKSFDVYTQVTVDDTTANIVLNGYRWYATHFKIADVSNSGTFTFISNIVEQDFEIREGNDTYIGDNGIAILIGHDSANSGSATTPDKYIYVTGDYSGRASTGTNNFDNSPKKISYTFGTVGNYARIWLLVGIKPSKSDKYISQISLTPGA